MNPILAALESGLEYARKVLARHDAELGAHTKREAELTESHIAAIVAAIDSLKLRRIEQQF